MNITQHTQRSDRHLSSTAQEVLTFLSSKCGRPVILSEATNRVLADRFLVTLPLKSLDGRISKWIRENKAKTNSAFYRNALLLLTYSYERNMSDTLTLFRILLNTHFQEGTRSDYRAQFELLLESV